jgi:hypothetical protein
MKDEKNRSYFGNMIAENSDNPLVKSMAKDKRGMLLLLLIDEN